MLSSSEPNPELLILLDWDDTIMPTTYLQRRGIDLTTNEVPLLSFSGTAVTPYATAFKEQPIGSLIMNYQRSVSFFWNGSAFSIFCLLINHQKATKVPEDVTATLKHYGEYAANTLRALLLHGNVVIVPSSSRDPSRD